MEKSVDKHGKRVANDSLEAHIPIKDFIEGCSVMLTDEDKKYTLNEFLRHLSHMQDKEYQSRIWVRNEGPECQAFDDAVCDFFDIGDPILEDYKNFGITKNQYTLLKKFRKEFKEFSDENDFPEEFIDTPEWERIMNLAKDVLKAFDY